MSQGESGGSEPHLFETGAGKYMVKAANCPQGPRVLVNELVGGLCLDWLGVTHPATAVVNVSAEVITLSNGGARFNSGAAIASGFAFGSEFWQSDPQGTVATDLIVNRMDVAGAYALDTWIKPWDSRQYRVRGSQNDPGRYQFIPLDHGHSIGGPDWQAAALDAQHSSVSLPADPVTPIGRDDLSQFVARLAAFDREAAHHIVSQVPDSWCTPEERKSLIDYLVARASLAAQQLVGRP